MPYKLKGNCVVKADTGETVKCHKTHAEALAHLRALEINVSDAKSILSDDEWKRIDIMANAFNNGFISIKAPHDYHTDKFNSCKEQLLNKGYDEASAHAICYASLGEGANRSYDLNRFMKIGARNNADKKSLSNDPEKAKEYLDKAIALHQAHMDGTEPTSDASQQKLMNYITNAQKVGARHSQSDVTSIQTIHDNAVSLGAECMSFNEGITAMLNGKSVKSNIKAMKMMEMTGTEYAIHEGWDVQQCCSVVSQVIGMCQDECMEGEMDEAKFLCDVAMSLLDHCKGECQEMMDAMNEGNNTVSNYAMMSKSPAQIKSTDGLNLSYVKSLHVDIPDSKLAVKYVGKNTIAHPVFIWGDEKKTDLEVEYFNKSTDFWDKQLEGFERPLTWEHGQDKKFEEFEDNPVIGKTVKYHDDAIARWAESVITTDKEYRKFIDQFIEEKRLGYSSDSAPQYVKREKTGKATWLKMWAWFGGSLTASPCEPRMKLFTPEFLKSLGIVIPDVPEEEWETDMAIIDYYKTIYRLGE